MSVLEKSKTDVKKKTSEVPTSLNDLGTALMEWDGEDFDVLSKPMKDTLNSCMSSFEETGIADFLLCSFLIQQIVSYVLAREVMGGLFKMQPKFVKEDAEHLGKEIIRLGQSANQEAFRAQLMALLIFAHKNRLLPISPRS